MRIYKRNRPFKKQEPLPHKFEWIEMDIAKNREEYGLIKTDLSKQPLQPKEFFGWLCKSQQDATFCLFLIRNLFFLRDKNLSHSQSLIKNTYFPAPKHRVKEKKTQHLIQYSVIQFFFKGLLLPP